MKSVKWILISLNLDYAHVVVTDTHGMPYGGGSPATVIERFGNMQVESSAIIDNILYLRVSISIR